jgi:hypothetical protein
MNQQNEDFDNGDDEELDEVLEEIKNHARQCRFGISHRRGLECLEVMEWRRRGNLLGPRMSVEQTAEMAATVPRCLVMHGHFGDVFIASAIMKAAERGVSVAEVWFKNNDAGDAA